MDISLYSAPNMNIEEIKSVITDSIKRGFYIILFNKGKSKGFIKIPREIRIKGKLPIAIKSQALNELFKGSKGVYYTSDNMESWMSTIGKVNDVRKGTKSVRMSGISGGSIRVDVDVPITVYVIEYISNIRLITAIDKRVKIYYNVRSEEIENRGKRQRIINSSVIKIGEFNGFYLINNLVYNNRVIGKRIKLGRELEFDVSIDTWKKINSMEKYARVQEKIRNCKMINVGGQLMTSSELKHGESMVAEVEIL